MTANTPRGYTYPQSTDDFRPYEDFQELATDIDTDVQTLANSFGAWTAYTPTYTASGGGAALGNGSIGGRYRRFGKTVHFQAKMTWGTTTTVGSAFLRFGLPSTRLTTMDFVGAALLLDASSGTAGYNTATALAGSTEANYVLIAFAGGFVQATLPWTWANTDVVRWSGTYEEP